MPLNILRFGSPRPREAEEGNISPHAGGGGFFQRNFRRNRPSDGGERDPSMRRQAMLRGMSMRRSNSEDSDIVLPVLPPGDAHRGADHEILSDTTDTFDGESYVEVPRDMHPPSEHRAPNFHDGAHPPAPVMQREGGHMPGSSYEPSFHNFAPGSSAGITYSDVSGSPGAHRAREADNPRYGRREGDRSHDMGNYRGGRGHPHEFGSPMSSHSSDSNGMVIPPEMGSPHSSSSRSRGFDNPRRSQGRPRERGIERPRYPGGYAGQETAHMPVHPVPTVPRSETEDSELTEGRMHPAFRGESQGSHSSTSSGSMIIPPEPHQRSRGIDVSHPQGHAPPIRERAMPVVRSDGSHRRGRSEPQHYEPTPDTYYIIPPGTNVIFQDEDGNEIHRVGDFSGRPKRNYKEQPIVVQDEFGREIYRTPGYGVPEDRVSYMDHYGNTPNIILLDREGRQIPISHSSGSNSGGSMSSRSDRHEGSEHSGSSGTVSARHD